MTSRNKMNNNNDSTMTTNTPSRIRSSSYDSTHSYSSGGANGNSSDDYTDDDNEIHEKEENAFGPTIIHSNNKQTKRNSRGRNRRRRNHNPNRNTSINKRSSSYIRIVVYIFIMGLLMCMTITTIIVNHISTTLSSSNDPYMNIQNKFSSPSSLMMLRHAVQNVIRRHNHPYDHNITNDNNNSTDISNNINTSTTILNNNAIIDNNSIEKSNYNNILMNELNKILIGFNESDNGKEQIYTLVKEALGIQSLTELNDYETIIKQLPNISDIIKLYGSKPIVYGLETCSIFQNKSGIDLAQHFVSVAGTFNTGTNIMSELLIANCYMPERYKKYHTAGVRWQVIWGKHTPIYNETYRQIHKTGLYISSNTTATNDSSSSHELLADNVFPAVMIRDPYKWMQSMCRHDYAARWHRDAKHPLHCPNLVYPSNTSSVSVKVYYKDFILHHNSLIQFWNDWYNDYINAKFPRLIIRYEDLIFHPKTITKLVCKCAGGDMKYNDNNFIYITDSAKKGKAHGSEKTGYIDALIKYGTEYGRYDGYYNEDLIHTKDNLDSNLMKLFKYKYHNHSNIPSLS